MKSVKYAALCLNVLALALLASVLFGVYGLLAQRTPQVRAGAIELKPVPPRTVTDRQQVAVTLDAIARINARMGMLSTGGDADAIALPAAGTPGAAGPSMPQRSVTMLVQQGGEYVAVVDGRLVRPGAVLDQGGRVLSIGRDAVVVREVGGRQTLTMPVAQLRVGTMRSSAAPDTTTVERRFNPARTDAQGASP